MMGDPTVRELIEQWSISRSEITTRAPSGSSSTLQPHINIPFRSQSSLDGMNFDNNDYDELPIKRINTASLPTDAWTRVTRNGKKANHLLRKELEHVTKLRDSLRLRQVQILFAFLHIAYECSETFRVYYDSFEYRHAIIFIMHTDRVMRWPVYSYAMKRLPSQKYAPRSLTHDY